MIRLRLTLDVGKIEREPEPEVVPGLTDGDAQATLADRQGPGWDRAGFCLPDHD